MLCADRSGQMNYADDCHSHHKGGLRPPLLVSPGRAILQGEMR